MISDKLPINELYTCLQGEGKYAGIPHILVRFVGCKLRCQFKNSVCDTSFNSWKPEKGKFTWSDLDNIIVNNKQIKHVMITGGGPTMHGDLLRQVVNVFKDAGLIVTIETEGSEFVQTEADLISLSPKLSSSTPRLGSTNPYTQQEVKQSMIDQHEKWRRNYDAMKQLISNHKDWILKPVVSDEKDLEEVKLIQKELNASNDRVYLMPEGVTDEQLQKTRKWLFDVCVKEGYRYSDRLHIIAFGDVRFK